MKALKINNLSCSYGDQNILIKLNLDVDSNEIVCLLGKSGCGKTTLLKTIAGLSRPTSGTIHFYNQEVSSPTHVIPPEKRGIGMIFQDYALFPHLTVYKNIAFGLHQQSSQQIKVRVHELLELVNLQGLGKSYPHELSGGQQQRVAIARALANRPQLLLLDEPFSNIDNQVRQRLIADIRDILKQQSVAALFVTHNKEEGFSFADTIALMSKGSILQTGSAFDIYQHPANRFAAEFMGLGNYVAATPIDKRHLATDIGVIRSTSSVAFNKTKKSSAYIIIRPENIQITQSDSTNASPKGNIIQQQFMGHIIRSKVAINGSQVVVEHKHLLEKSKSVSLTVKPHPVLVFDQEGNVIS